MSIKRPKVLTPLDHYLIECRRSRAELAEAMGMARQTLHRKIHGERALKSDEAQRAAEVVSGWAQSPVTASDLFPTD